MTSGRQAMKNPNKRVTVYLKPEYHRALRVKAAETEYSVSDLVNAALKNALLEDAADLEAFDKRAREPLLAFEDVLKALKRDGKI
jgi:predicted HicB family RNase H-like nuclease